MAISFNGGASGVSFGNSAPLSATGGTSTISQINQNDLLIAVVTPEGYNGSDPGTVTPPPGEGWVQIDNTALSIQGLAADAAIFYKIAGANETGNYNFAWSSGAECSWALLDYSGVDTSSPIDPGARGLINSNGYSQDTTAPSVVANAGDTLVNFWISKGGDSGGHGYHTAPGTTVRVDSQSSSSTHPEILISDRVLSSSGDTGPDVMHEAFATYGQFGFSLALNAAICFMPGTMIRTPDGEVAVETLKRGDLVLTSDGRAMPVTWLGRQTISRLFADPLRVLPIRIKARALADNVPSRDLLLSPDHAVLVDGALIHAGALVNGTSIERETDTRPIFTYYHVEVDDHSLILAENTPAETFVDNVDRLNFDNWEEHLALYPDGKAIQELPYPRAKAQRQVPRAIREQLAERAATLVSETKYVAA